MQLCRSGRVSDDEREQRPMRPMRIGRDDAADSRARDAIRDGNGPGDADSPAGASDEVAPVAGSIGGAVGESTEQLFDKAVAAHSRRLLAIARAIVGTR